MVTYPIFGYILRTHWDRAKERPISMVILVMLLLLLFHRFAFFAWLPFTMCNHETDGCRNVAKFHSKRYFHETHVIILALYFTIPFYSIHWFAVRVWAVALNCAAFPLYRFDSVSHAFIFGTVFACEFCISCFA